MEVEVEKVKRNSGYKYSFGPFHIKLFNDKDGNSAADKFLEKLNNKTISNEKKEEKKAIFVQMKMRQYKVLANGGEWDLAAAELNKAIFGGI